MRRKNNIDYVVESEKFVYLPISEIYPHPDNPRKDLGDLSELSESIKLKGILQNLTVVPGHYQTREEWEKLNKEYKETPTDELRAKINARHYDDGYTVIIGHRRLAAAKAAGMKLVPCIVSDMDEKEQCSTMLIENMQRSDLTVYEQAKGFQMMLDFGDSVEDIAEKSGFSQSTIRRRVKLLELDEEKFKKSQTRNVSLFDYMELDKIKDNDLKNAVLDSIGTENFKYDLKKALEQEEIKEYLDSVEAEVSKFAIKIEDTAGYLWVTEYGSWNKKSVIVPDDTDTVQYYYGRDRSYIAVYKKKEEIPADEEAERIRAAQEAEKKRRRCNLAEATKRAYELRKEAINCISNSYAEKHIAEIVAFIMAISSQYDPWIDAEDIAKILQIDFDADEFEDWGDDKSTEYMLDLIKTESKKKAGIFLLKYAYALSKDKKNNGYYSSWSVEYSTNNRLDLIYDFLCKLGYEMSDEEKALRDGTHEMFIKEEVK